MTTFAQSTIHSKIAKMQKTNGEAIGGRVVKGTITGFGNTKMRSSQNDSHIMKEIQVLPKNRLNIARKMKNRRVIPGTNKNQQIVLMESSLFPAIYFKKTTMRNVLKQFSFPDNCHSLESTDDRTPMIYQIVANLFNQISFFIFNILIGENLVTNSFYIFFSDSETIPFTKCCNAPVFIELMQNGSGKILCNADECKHPNLAQFLINFEDGKKLWPNITYFSEASEKDKRLKNKISKLILNGKYKKRNLVEMVQQTSKQIVEIFYNSKNKYEPGNQQFDQFDEQVQEQVEAEGQNPFLTAAGHKKSSRRPIDTGSQRSQLQSNDNLGEEHLKDNEEQAEKQIVDPDEKNIETLKMKLMYVTKKQKGIDKQLYKGIVESSKIFRSEFDLVRRIDELLLKNRNTKGSSKFNFPRIMNQVKKADKMQKNRSTIRSKSLYDPQN